MSIKREHLIQTAIRLFRENGYHATGIDRILTEAGVAKNTLYKHFHSKNELILTTLRREDEQMRNWIMREVERRADSPREKLLIVFDVAREWFSKAGLRGCPFIRASGEFSDKDHPIHAACLEHSQLIRRYLEQLARQANAIHPETLSHQLMLLFIGATVSAQAQNGTFASDAAKSAADILIESECRRS